MKTFPHLGSVSLAAALMLLGALPAATAGGVDQDNPLLPPAGVYLTPADVHAMFSGPGLAIVLSQVQHTPFANGLVERHTVPGTMDEIENFQSSVSGLASVNGSPDTPVSGNGPVSVLVHDRVASPTGTFDTEMLSLNLTAVSPFGPFMIRESPTLPSLGQTKITDIGGGMFHIDSFFDVFTELSIDGGANWMPSAGSTHVDLVPMPEPSTWVMLAVGVLGLLGRAARRHGDR